MINIICINISILFYLECSIPEISQFSKTSINIKFICISFHLFTSFTYIVMICYNVFFFSFNCVFYFISVKYRFTTFSYIIYFIQFINLLLPFNDFLLTQFWSIKENFNKKEFCIWYKYLFKNFFLKKNFVYII